MESDSALSDIEVVPKRKRGVRDLELYKRNQIKVVRVKGIEYTNYRGKNVKKRELGSPCR